MWNYEANVLALGSKMQKPTGLIVVTLLTKESKKKKEKDYREKYKIKD